jgi:hypothetical protein
MHLLVILLQQLLGMLPSKQPVPQAEVVRPRSTEPRNSDSASFVGHQGVGHEGAWGDWTVLSMLEAKEIRAPWGAEFRWRREPGTKVSGMAVSGLTVDHIRSPGESPGEL